VVMSHVVGEKGVFFFFKESRVPRHQVSRDVIPRGTLNMEQRTLRTQYRRLSGEAISFFHLDNHRRNTRESTSDGACW
jgi:hypothetical protein